MRWDFLPLSVFAGWRECQDGREYRARMDGWRERWQIQFR